MPCVEVCFFFAEHISLFTRFFVVNTLKRWKMHTFYKSKLRKYYIVRALVTIFCLQWSALDLRILFIWLNKQKWCRYTENWIELAMQVYFVENQLWFQFTVDFYYNFVVRILSVKWSNQCGHTISIFGVSLELDQNLQRKLLACPVFSMFQLLWI